MAQANALIQGKPIVIEELPAIREDWVMPVKTDPFSIATDVKAAYLLAITDAALKSGADYCYAHAAFRARGEILRQQPRQRDLPDAAAQRAGFMATAIDKATGKFASRDSLAPPRGAGWDYVESCGLLAEAAQAGGELREKLGAKSVEPGKYDMVIAPSNLFLTIHETVGHSTELDRALGWEADFAGTSFVTPGQARHAAIRLAADDHHGRPLAGWRAGDGRLRR